PKNGAPKNDVPELQKMEPSNTESNNTELKDLDTTDTDRPTPTNNDESINEKAKYLKEGFLNNQEYIPKTLANMLNALSNNTEQAKKYYEIILQAKAKVEKNTFEVIWLEEEPYILQ